MLKAVVNWPHNIKTSKAARVRQIRRSPPGRPRIKRIGIPPVTEAAPCWLLDIWLARIDFDFCRLLSLDMANPVTLMTIDAGFRRGRLSRHCSARRGIWAIVDEWARRHGFRVRANVTNTRPCN